MRPDGRIGPYADPAHWQVARASYVKTTAMAGLSFAMVLLIVALAPQILPLATVTVAQWLFTIAALLFAGVWAGGLLVLSRHGRRHDREPDVFARANFVRHESNVLKGAGHSSSPVRRAMARVLLGHDFLVGDEVVVRSLDEIHATLDSRRRKGGIAFHPDMARFCGQRFRVYRCVDKIYDYGRTKRMRGLDGFVMLAGLRCAGQDFDGCEARCYLLWNVAWLEKPRAPVVATPRRVSPSATDASRSPPSVADAGKTYDCQFTQLHHASRALRDIGLLQEIRPLIAGNVALRAAVIAWLTRFFNWVQRKRGGIAYPYTPQDPAPQATQPSAELQPGQRVTVAPFETIARTLNAQGRNKGLWFDPDMTKFCGTEQVVLAKVDRIIDDANGQMRIMKTPCYALEGVDYCGEFMQFNPQHDTFFWRAYWLTPISGSAVP